MEKIIINIDSKYRDKELYPNSSKFSIPLDRTIKNMIDIKISSVEFSNLSYFLFSNFKNNITFMFTINAINYYLKIADGFYSSNVLIKSIQDQFDILLLNNPNQMTITLNPITGKVTLSGTSSFSIDFSNNSNYPSLGYYLGFINNSYLNKLSITCESILNLSIDNYLFLKVNNYGSMYANLSNNEKNILYPYNILGKIILDLNKTTGSFDNNNLITKEYIFRKPVNISKFDIELLDPYGTPIDMLFSDFSFTLELNYIYDFNPY